MYCLLFHVQSYWFLLEVPIESFKEELKALHKSTIIWCKGERIELKLNMNYVNLLVDTTRINESNLADLCLKYGLEVKTKINNNGFIKAQRKGELIDASEFENYLQNIRKDERILYVFPFFESLNGKELIGSSQRFYVQLKEI